MCKLISSTIIVFISLFSSGNVDASSQLGYGNTKCAIYNAVQGSGGELASNIDSWALGYISGLNYAAVERGEPDKLRRHQPDRIAAFLRTFCNSKANGTVVEAANSYWLNSGNK